MVLFLFCGGRGVAREGRLSVLFPSSACLRLRREAFAQVLGELAFFFQVVEC